MNKAELAELRQYYDTTDQSDAIASARWEYDVDPDPMIVTSLRLPKSLLDWVRGRAERERIKPTALIRRWIEDARAAADDQAVTLEGLAARVDRLERAEHDSMADLLRAVARSVDAARAGADADPGEAEQRDA